uniref:Putative secreted protein n=1 Tax=Panstrongylus lignarius TaxID=156445 RepID=A0A224Y0N5_9HEMI
MGTVTFLTFQLLGVLFLLNCFAEAKICAGCVQDADPNSPEIKKQLVGVLAAENEDYDIIRVIRAKTQVVSGIRYIVDFEVKDRQTNKVKFCNTSFVCQPWRFQLPVVQQFSCHDK